MEDKSIDQQLALARNLYDSLEYQLVVPLTKDILSHPALRPDQLVKAYELQGSSLVVIGDPIEAEKPFRLLLRLRPDFDLAASAPPKIVAVFRKVQVEENVGLRRADPRLQEAYAMLTALEVERSVVLFDALLADPEISQGVRARAWLGQGLAQASLPDVEKARTAFAAALELEPSLHLPSDVSPKIAALFSEVKAARASVAVPPSKTTVAAQEARPAPGWNAWVTVGLLGGGVAAAAGAVAAEVWLGTPESSRTRESYDSVRGLGVVAGVSAALLTVSGAAVWLAPVFLPEEAP